MPSLGKFRASSSACCFSSKSFGVATQRVTLSRIIRSLMITLFRSSWHSCVSCSSRGTIRDWVKWLRRPGRVIWGAQCVTNFSKEFWGQQEPFAASTIALQRHQTIQYAMMCDWERIPATQLAIKRQNYERTRKKLISASTCLISAMAIKYQMKNTRALKKRQGEKGFAYLHCMVHMFNIIQDFLLDWMHILKGMYAQHLRDFMPNNTSI